MDCTIVFNPESYSIYEEHKKLKYHVLCVDVNECSSSASNNCHQKADCHNNNDGSFRCTCPSGFTWNGISNCNGMIMKCNAFNWASYCNYRDGILALFFADKSLNTLLSFLNSKFYV